MAISALIMVALGAWVLADFYTSLPPGVTATYVGQNRCVQCHQTQHKEWQGSDHDLAMDVATPESVLGDFNNAEVTHHDVVSRMFRDGDRYMIHTEGPDGKMGDFEIKYVFGVRPLQQYMVEFDRDPDMPANEIARLQVLRISWDTAKKKWFYLPPPDVSDKLAVDDDLHWTGIAQCWNTMCADCHSTNLQKNYDTATGRYHTTFTDIDVSCEACHGPGSTHVQLAESKSLFWDRNLGYGLPKLKSTDAKVEIESCAPCHSRRRIVHPEFTPGKNFCDYFQSELLQENVYHADGQILDEVYVYGSFIQSKMYHKNIRCTDCHDPHTTRIKHEGNKLCTSCHQHPAGKYDTPGHHHHTPGSTGASCVECHMPEATYMAVDDRRDHSLRVPRPDVSVELGTPNACSRCHLKEDKLLTPNRDDLKQYNDYVLAALHGDAAVKTKLKTLDERMTAATTGWYGPPKEDPARAELAAALLEAQKFNRDSAVTLEKLGRNRTLTPISRATAMTELGRFSDDETLATARTLLKDADPQVRIAAIGHYEPFLPALRDTDVPEQQLQQLAEQFRPYFRDLLPLLADPIRSVRIEAARILARAPTRVFGMLSTGPQREQFEKSLVEYIDGMLVSNDRGGAHLTLGLLYDHRGDTEKAIAAYETAMRVQPTMTGPRSNLSEIYDRKAEIADQQARQAMNAYQQLAVQARQLQQVAGEAAVKQAEVKVAEKRAEIESLAEQVGKNKVLAEKWRAAEFPYLERDARLAPENGPVQYRYALALYLRGRIDDAEAAMTKAQSLEPLNPQYLLGLALLYQKQERIDEAIKLTQELIRLEPNRPDYQLLLQDLLKPAEKE
ncbi:tetratricopeptide repeat protein [Lignipirellula cremea]|uniref:tetratricopeptide repeat protein n=1 Tax=Lignipirellula cremea TaxID=2528010 RepID=UPI0018D268D6|nr:tetratricopeptide repeat protein [Lignipirellula cremea]